MLWTIFLWIHASAGAIWATASACFVIAGLALAPNSVEQRNFVNKAAAAIERIGLLAAATLLVTGLINLFTVATFRGFALPTQFVVVLSIKILLFIAMTVVLIRAMRVGGAIRALLERARAGAIPSAMTTMVRAHFAIAVMGSMALILGLWLSGS
jgi:hypothetical protein